MSVIYKGTVIDTNLSHSAMGGTEQMRQRLIENINSDLLNKVAIHLSRPRILYEDVPNIMWAHDTAEDPENKILDNTGWTKFDAFVFVSCWQRDMYIARFGIPYSKCMVIENAIEPTSSVDKASDKIRLIYHTTPHRGLELLYPVYEVLSKEFGEKVHLDVFSSFQIYGWKERDKKYANLYEKLRKHNHITYHGTQSNSVVREYLSRAHYFPYPCIWKETSCIALIEAIEHDVIAIHPNYGALPETAGMNTIMYDYTEDHQVHANTMLSLLRTSINRNFHNAKNINSSPTHNIETFTKKWTSLLKAIS
jgi:glycosyltransferase involved in cell wall biosynthesis